MLIESGGADGSVCGSDLVRSGDGGLCGASMRTNQHGLLKNIPFQILFRFLIGFVLLFELNQKYYWSTS